MGWPIRKNTAPATAETLRTSAAKLALAISENETRHTQGSTALADLADDPVAFAEAQDALDVIEGAIRRDKRALALIEPKIAEAEEREALASLEKEAADLDRRTGKLERKLADRYPGLAEAMGSLFEELEANSDEWNSLGSKLREAGLGHLSKHDAEFRARRSFPAAVWPHFTSLWRTALVVALDGSTRFRGPAHRYEVR